MLEISEISTRSLPVRCIVTGPVASGKTTFSGMLSSAIQPDVIEVWRAVHHPREDVSTYHRYSTYLPYEIPGRALFHLQDSAYQGKCIIIEEWLRTSTFKGVSSQIENFLDGIKHFPNISVLIVSQLIESPFLYEIDQIGFLKTLMGSHSDESLRFSVVQLGKDAIQYASRYLDQAQFLKLQTQRRPCLFNSIPVHFPEKI